jgi:hypothetical protein
MTVTMGLAHPLTVALGLTLRRLADPGPDIYLQRVA